MEVLAGRAPGVRDRDAGGGRGQREADRQLASSGDVFSPTWGMDAAQLGLETPRNEPRSV